MKKNFNQIIAGLLMTLTCFGTAFNLASCADEDSPMKSVDLRYNSKNEYLIAAAQPEEITFEVKSTDPWEVLSQSAWCMVSPESGPAGEVCSVTLRFKDNTGLDDRMDTVTIKSDYWVGKRIAITQKGTAYLNLEGHEGLILNKESDRGTFEVKSNQNWSTEVTLGGEWLSITSGATGKLDGQVEVAVVPNKGERRTGEVTVYDRHHVKVATVSIVQDGLLLQPEMLTIKALDEAQTFILKVESNAEWTIRIADEEQEWLTLPQTSFVGNAEVEIVLERNAGMDVRSVELILSTKVVEGSQPVVKTVLLKQANLPMPTRSEFASSDLGGTWLLYSGVAKFDGDANFTVGRVSMEGCDPGYYSFRIKEMSADAAPVLFFTYGGTEIRWHINAATGKTDISTTPWISIASKNVAIDIKQPHTMSIHLTDVGGFTQVDWILDGNIFATHIADMQHGPFEIKYGAKAKVILGCSKGSCSFDWHEYTAPINWNN